MPSGRNPMGGYRFFRNDHAQNKKPGRDRFDPKLWRLGYAEDFTWRVKELSDLKQVIRLSGNPYAAVARKAALALVYAHWEGYVVFVAAAYIATCQLPRGLPRSPVRPSARRPGCVLPPRRNAVSFPHCQEPPSPCPRYCNWAMRSPVARHGPVYTLLAKGRGRALTISRARPKCHRLHTTGCPSGSAPHRFGRYRSGVDLVTVCFHNGGKAVLADDLPGVGIKRDRRPAVAVDRERVPGFWHFANSIGSHPHQCGARCMIQN
jgi:hypothetical protein